MKYTIEELHALPDADLNALAAELRGLKRIGGDNRGGDWVDKFDAFYDEIFTPSVDRNQSGELLEWFVETQWRAHYTIRSGKLFRSVCVTAATDGDDVNVEANGTGAKAETVAFCAAMLAMKERLTNVDG